MLGISNTMAETWATLVVVFLVIVAAATIGISLYRAKKYALPAEESDIIYPFSGFTSLTKYGSNTPQIQCPVGKKINIIGAFYEVYDPFFQCYKDGPSEDLKNLCKATSSSIPTEYQPTCVNPSGSTIINSNFQNTTCLPPSPSAGGPPIDRPTQANTVQGLPVCTMRDVSAIVAHQCDDRQVCLPSLSPPNMGPVPCAVFSNNSNTALSNLSTLPNVPGRSSLANSDGTASLGSTAKQGYYVHGLYTCI